MMPLDQQLLHDRAMRDAARANVAADLEHLKLSLSGKGISNRIFDRIGDGAKDVFEQASDVADDNRGIIAALVGAILLWLSRGPILELLGLADDQIGEPIDGANAESGAGSNTAPHPYPSGEDDD